MRIFLAVLVAAMRETGRNSPVQEYALPAALAGLTAGGRGLAARPDPAQRGPDGERRDPGRHGDLPQRLPGGVQPGDPCRQRGVSFDAPWARSRLKT